MFWITSMAIALLVFTTVMFLARSFRKEVGAEKQNTAKTLGLAGSVVFALWVIVHTATAAIYQVPAGNVGVVYSFGQIVGQTEEGLQTVAPWKSVKLANVQIQRHVFEKLESFSKESQTVYVRASLNIRISPHAIQTLYRTVGAEYFHVLVDARVAQNFKDELVKYESVKIAPNRENIRREVSARLEKELSPHSIEVVDLLLDNVDFMPEFEKAIEAKQIATQRSLEEEQKVVVERHKAEQAVERAKGEGAATLALAEKQAEANKKLSESLTPSLIQYSMIQKLSDKISVMIMPQGQNFIMDSSALKGIQPEKK